MTEARGRTRAKKRVPLSPAALAEAALAHLNRSDASSKKLESRLERWVIDRAEPADLERARPWIRALLERYRASGLIDEERLAKNVLDRQRERGGSARAIAFRLEHRGVSAGAIEAAFASERGSGDAELAAARALCARRKLGPFRAPSEREPNRRRDLAALARAGFSFEVARRALGAADGDDEF